MKFIRVIHWALLTIFISSFLQICSAASDGHNSPQELSEAVSAYLFEKTPENLKIIKHILSEGVKPDIQTLYTASYYKIPEVLDMLLVMGKNIINEPVQENGETLLLAALNNIDGEGPSSDEKHIIESLIKAGADVNVIGLGGSKTPLIVAAEGGRAKVPHPDLVDILLKTGADPKLTTPRGFTALTGAGAGNLDVIDKLIVAGADPYVVTSVGSTPLHFVCQRAYEMAGKPDPEAAKRIDKLLKSGTSIDAFHDQVNPWLVGTPLYESLVTNNPDCVRALLKKGANMDAMAYPDSAAQADPSVKGKTVRELALQGVKDDADGLVYSAEIIKILNQQPSVK
ncbi:hypothetical protein D8Z79_004365 [Escherichia fergusonii]|uniref:ankyrin repeat domain-containing protein n=1 Tax=Escherichia fergusonii TaxID=564 RepID=UPI000F671513|nr:ankyrin repeat domain-containing protein [Escherichia fergusonii]QCZ31168.1 hypothetical protein D8Z79_004365 [Escherichia fergusonii]